MSCTGSPIRALSRRRPRPAAEIIRRGDQRRRRRMVGGTVAGLAVAGAITGGILSGVAGGGVRPRRGRPAVRSRPPPTPRPAGGEHSGAGALRHLALGCPESQGLKPAAGAHQERLARARVTSPRPGVAGPSFRSCGYFQPPDRLLMPWLEVWVRLADEKCRPARSYSTLKLVWAETAGGQSVCISALHVDVTRRVHRGPGRRTGQPRR